MEGATETCGDLEKGVWRPAVPAMGVCGRSFRDLHKGPWRMTEGTMDTSRELWVTETHRRDHGNM